MASPFKTSPILGVAAAAVVIFFLQQASTIFVPILVASVLGVLGANPLLFLRHHHFPVWLAAILVMILMGGVITLFGYFMVNTIELMSMQFGAYKALFIIKYADLLSYLAQYDINVNAQLFNIDTVKGLLTSSLKGLGATMTNTVIVLFLLLFILLEIGSMEEKMQSIWPNGSGSTKAIKRVIESINHYLAIKTGTSFLTGLFVYFLALWLGIDFALFLGVLAFVLNFVPTIGSIIAAVPGIFLAWLALPVDYTILAIIGYLAINIGISNFIEPKFMGDGLGLSTLVVFISLLFWGWVFGIVGMLFSAILTMMVKIMLEASPNTYALSVLISNKR